MTEQPMVGSRLQRVTLIALVMLGASCARPSFGEVPEPEFVNTSSTNNPEVDFANVIDETLKGTSALGASVVLIWPDGRQQTHHWGHADAQRLRPVNSDTCWRVGSLTKTFTALLALKTDHRWPGFLDRPSTRQAHACSRGATPREWLEHTGGEAGWTHADYGEDWPNAPVKRVAQRASAREPLFCPGQHHAYANSGYSQVAAALEDAWQLPFDTLMDREIFAPLGMHSASLKTSQWPECLSDSVDRDGQPLNRWALADRAAGALIMRSTAIPALTRLLQTGDSHSDAAASAWSVAALEKMSMGTTGLGYRANQVPATYGLGLFRFVAAGHLFDGHWGRIDGFQTTYGVERASGRAFFVVINTADKKPMGELRERTAQKLMQDVPVRTPDLANGIVDVLWTGWYANISHDMKLRNRLWWLIDMVRLEVEPDGKRVWLRGPSGERELIAQGNFALRERDLPEATVSLAFDATGQRTLVDGSSYRKTSVVAVLGAFAVALGSGLSCLFVLVAMMVPRWRRVFSGATVWIGIAALSQIMLVLGILQASLWGGLAWASQLGRFGVLNFTLTAFSFLVPLTWLVSVWRLRSKRNAWPVLLGLGTGLAGLHWLGWIPLEV